MRIAISCSAWRAITLQRYGNGKYREKEKQWDKCSRVVVQNADASPHSHRVERAREETRVTR